MNTHLVRLALPFALALGGCQALSDALTTGPRRLSDDDAFLYLRPNRQEAPSTDMQSVMSLIEAEESANKALGEDLSDDEINLMRRVIHTRHTIDVDQFERLDLAQLAPDAPVLKSECGNDVDLGELYDEYLIPDLERVPVKNQGARGTCAAFAGIGALEYTALASTGLSSLDLSEQRFYWLSKPDCQASGACPLPASSQGSWHGNGYNASLSVDEPNIPLEVDCPYNASLGDTDTQTPQSARCAEGALKVDSVETYCGAEGIIKMLHEGHAVPFASPLSSNWESNDGMITLEGFTEGGSTVHAGGHAYLIVGYRKIADRGEGGMCFMVKNSWGTGWGVNGYACQTLAWTIAISEAGPWNGLQMPMPVATAISLSDELRDGLPDKDEDSDTAEDIPEEDDEGLPPEEEDEEPTPPPLEYQEVNLLGSTEQYHRVEVASQDGKLWVRGVLRNDQGVTSAIALKEDGNSLRYEGDEVGQLNGDELKLCTGEWAHLCSLRMRASDNKLYLQFRDDDLRSVKASEISAEQGSWLGVDLGTREYGLFIPNNLDVLIDPKIYVRLGSSTPSRLSIRAKRVSELEVRLQGEGIGHLPLLSPMDASLCSGDYADRCRLVGRDTLHVIPRNIRKL